MIDRLGTCPNQECNEDWDDGDVYEVLSMMDINLMKAPSELLKIAAEYGWTPDNKKNFSLANTIELEPTPSVKILLYECPSCKKVYEAVKETEFNNLYEAKRKYYATETP